jgi:hypothetical protein
MGVCERYSCVAFYNTSNAVSYAFDRWKHKSEHKKPFLSFYLEDSRDDNPIHQAVSVGKVSAKNEHCLVFEVKRGRSSGHFRKPKNLLWFFIVPGSSQATAEEMVRLGVDEMLSRRIPEDEFFFGYHPAPERFTAWPFAMREHARLSV